MLLCLWNSPGKNIGVGNQPFPSSGDLPHLRTEPGSPALQADSLWSEASGSRFHSQKEVAFYPSGSLAVLLLVIIRLSWSAVK